MMSEAAQRNDFRVATPELLCFWWRSCDRLYDGAQAPPRRPE